VTVPVGFDPPFDPGEFTAQGRVRRQFGPAAQIELRLVILRWKFDRQGGHALPMNHYGRWRQLIFSPILPAP